MNYIWPKITLFFLIQGLFLAKICHGARECRLSYYGFDYRGKVAITSGGKTCQSWSSQSPHPHTFTKDYMFADGSVEEAKNYCRNPNERSGGPWCYTTDSSTTWQYCSIPRCSVYPECRVTESGSEYRGNIAITRNKERCAFWGERAPIKGNGNLDHNFCRNPDRRGLPWCYVQGEDQRRWNYCDVPFCKPPMHCIPQSANFTSFVGTLSVTEHGRMCQRWSSQSPHKHEHTDDEVYPDGSIENANNYCRNPDGDPNGVWCYTTDPEVRWEYCNLPRCQGDCKVSKTGREYNGQRSTTRNGRECLRWDKHPSNMTSPDRYPDATASAAENYCRNPDGRSGGPWCFFNETQWDFCDIPNCPVDTDSYPRTPRAKHVLHIGVDGLHPDCIRSNSLAMMFGIPNINNRLVRQGTHTFTRARTVLNTVSGPGWSTMLCGQGVETSGVTSNSWGPVWQGKKEKMNPVNGVSYPIPCVFQGLKSQDATIHTAFYYDWDWLRHFANSGVPGSVDNDHHCSPLMDMIPVCDATMATNASAYIREVAKAAERTYTFVYLGNVDLMGHSLGWCSFLYGTGVRYADWQVGELLNAIDEVGSDDFLVMLSTDHGGSGTRHGREIDADIRIPLFMRGPGIAVNTEFPYTVQTRDMVPTAADMLGLRQNPWWTGRVLKEAYQTNQSTRPKPPK